MRLTSLAIVVLALAPAFGQKSGPSLSGSDLPQDVALQEQFILLSAKLKNLSEVQDLILKQQQLLLQHLEELRQDVDLLKQGQTNAVTRVEWQGFPGKIDELQQQMRQAQATNQQTVVKLVQDLLAKERESKTSAGTNFAKGLRIEGYRVQAGDTLSKIVIRLNDLMDRNNLPHLTQEQVESANPGLNPDRIRAGQLLLIPVPNSSESNLSGALR
jgi:LysM repeat protein